jgi:serine/threonine protein kinase
MSLSSATRLGHHTVLSALGAGGMGEVRLAEDMTLKRKVALKVLPAQVADDPDRLARYQREAEAVAALFHPTWSGLTAQG